MNSKWLKCWMYLENHAANYIICFSAQYEIVKLAPKTWFFLFQMHMIFFSLEKSSCRVIFRSVYIFPHAFPNEKCTRATSWMFNSTFCAYDVGWKEIEIKPLSFPQATEVAFGLSSECWVIEDSGCNQRWSQRWICTVFSPIKWFSVPRRDSKAKVVVECGTHLHTIQGLVSREGQATLQTRPQGWTEWSRSASDHALHPAS